MVRDGFKGIQTNHNSMNVRPGHATLVIILAIWAFIRVFPLVAFPGLYSYDAWNHLGYLMAIAEGNRVPNENPIWFPYYRHPGLHLFALIIHQFLGLPLMISLQTTCLVLIFTLFFAFYAFLRTLLLKDWQAQFSLLILALAPDFITQTNAALPEVLGLTFLILGLLSIIKIVRDPYNQKPYLLILSFILLSLFLAHHLTTLMFMLGCIAILAGVLLFRKSLHFKTGILITSIPGTFSFLLLFFFDPFVYGMFERYALPVILSIIGILIALGVIAIISPRLVQFFTWIQNTFQPRISLLLGVILFFAFIVITTVYYPVERFFLWRIWKFGLLSMLLGLAITVLPPIPNPKVRGLVAGSFLFFWLTLIAALFIGASILAFSSPQWTGFLSPVASLAHRQFNYLTIAATPLACVAISIVIKPKLHLIYSRRARLQKIAALGVIILLGVFLIGGSTNVYYPAGGWHQLWFPQPEIDSAYWLADHRGDTSITITDARLEALFRGIAPYLPTNNIVIHFNSSILAYPLLFNRTGNGYLFISTLMEQQFSLDFSIPPFSLPLRNQFDANPSLARVYDSSTVTIYYFRPS